MKKPALRRARKSTLLFVIAALLFLAGLLEAQGDVSAALQLVEPVYASFEEGLDTPDLVDAASLIERLGGIIVPPREMEVT